MHAYDFLPFCAFSVSLQLYCTELTLYEANQIIAVTSGWIDSSSCVLGGLALYRAAVEDL